MSIVKETVEARGGSIHIGSTPRLGTKFTLMLPVRTTVDSPEVSAATPLAEVTRPPQARPPSEVPEVPLVLIVDDSASIRRHTQMIVEEAGLRSMTAKDGAEALELLLNGTQPDLILSDVEMPHMDGWELCREIRRWKG